jgi:hypothetical protein
VLSEKKKGEEIWQKFVDVFIVGENSLVKRF